ncbi:MAG: hypothetical protein LBR25_06735 [Erysipelotrichaceae bacterium]|jgi:hypothetical protein|nr:hypothetical protein [Erysipelotrichaceae bacterium]
MSKMTEEEQRVYNDARCSEKQHRDKANALSYAKQQGIALALGALGESGVSAKKIQQVQKLALNAPQYIFPLKHIKANQIDVDSAPASLSFHEMWKLREQTLKEEQIDLATAKMTGILHVYAVMADTKVSDKKNSHSQ